MYLTDIGKTMDLHFYISLAFSILLLLVLYVRYTVKKSKLKKELEQQSTIASKIADYQRAFLAISTRGNIQNELQQREADQLLKEMREGTFFSRFTSNGMLDVEKCQKYFEDVSDKGRLEIVEHAEEVNLIPKKGVDISSDHKAHPVRKFSQKM